LDIEYISNNPPQTESIGADYAGMLPRGSIVLLTGDLGAGKTCFSRGFINSYFPGTLVSSPTFTLLNEYKNDQLTILHYDLYRLKTAEEAAELGIEDMISRADYTLIEWPETAEPLIEGNIYRVTVRMGAAEKERIILVEGDFAWKPSVSE